MTKLLCGIAAALSLIGTSSFAADMPVKAPPAAAPPVAFSWSGCYVGGYVGGAGAASTATSQDLNFYNGPDRWSYPPHGSVIGGGTLGCNAQNGNVVGGIEGQLGYLNVNGSRVDPFSPFLPLDTEAKTKFGDAYGVVAGRLGYVWNNTLLYVKVGGVVTRAQFGVNDSLLQPVIGNTIFTRTTKTEVAAAAAGGLEFSLNKSWTVRAEYLYFDLQASDPTCGLATIGGGRFCWSNSFRGIHTGMVGIDYFFGRWSSSMPRGLKV